MIILGLDPGIGRTGWGIIEKSGTELKSVAYGCIESAANSPTSGRLDYLFGELNAIISGYKPELAGVETLIFNTNVKTAMAVGEARGVLLLSLVRAGIKIREFSPLQVKQAVTGYGRAEKIQVQKMVRSLLHLEKAPKPDDASDALAVAICTSAILFP